MVIAQGALNSRSLARGGAYRPLTTCLQPVAGPILETVFSGDKALTGYNVFNTAPAGRVGFQDVAPMPTGTITLDNVADDRKCRDL